VKEHIIVGVNEGDVEKQLDLWLLENPAIRALKVHRTRPEPQNLLSSLDGKKIPRFSITVNYEEPDLTATFTADFGR
jgi:hypothetical protein